MPAVLPTEPPVASPAALCAWTACCPPSAAAPRSGQVAVSTRELARTQSLQGKYQEATDKLYLAFGVYKYLMGTDPAAQIEAAQVLAHAASRGRPASPASPVWSLIRLPRTTHVGTLPAVAPPTHPYLAWRRTRTRLHYSRFFSCRPCYHCGADVCLCTDSPRARKRRALLKRPGECAHAMHERIAHVPRSAGYLPH